jgi:hypothetical protein
MSGLGSSPENLDGSRQRPFETDNQPYEGRLAAAIRPRDADELSAPDGKVDVVEDHWSATVCEADAGGTDY